MYINFPFVCETTINKGGGVMYGVIHKLIKENKVLEKPMFTTETLLFASK